MWSFFFPGQGSQSPGMGRWLNDEFSVARQTFEEACDALNFDIRKLCFEGPEEELQKTENTQPAILAASIVYFRSLSQIVELKPLASAGHSVGEYAALVAADVIPFDKALKAVRERGLAMQSAVPLGIGGMYAVLNLEDSEVQSVCDWASKESGLGVIEPANYNTPGQVVISGIQETLNWLQQNWSQYKGPGSDKKARWIPLKVSAPFHCSLMKPAEEKMALFLKDIPFQSPKWPVIQNFTALESKKPESIKENLVRQISGAVRWTESVQRALQLGVTKGLELGHGQVIRGLNKKISSILEMVPLQNIEDLKSLEKTFKESSK